MRKSASPLCLARGIKSLLLVSGSKVVRPHGSGLGKAQRSLESKVGVTHHRREDCCGLLGTALQSLFFS